MPTYLFSFLFAHFALLIFILLSSESVLLGFLYYSCILYVEKTQFLNSKQNKEYTNVSLYFGEIAQR